MALPAIADVRRHFADASWRWPHGPGLRRSSIGACESIPWCHFNRRARRRDGGVRMRGLCALEDSNLAILLPNSFYAAWITRQAGIPERWGLRGDFRRPLLTRSASRPRATVHQGAYYQYSYMNSSCRTDR